MLVLTRKRSETILIGDDIVVKVLKTGKGTVKIGIEAPRHIRVLRGELCAADAPAPVEQTVDQRFHEGRRATEVEVAILIGNKLLYEFNVNIASVIIVTPDLVVGRRLAVSDVPVNVVVFRADSPNVVTQGMLALVAAAVNKPGWPLRTSGNDGV